MLLTLPSSLSFCSFPLLTALSSARRNYGEYQERYDGYDQLSMGDSCGIHASGAGFDKVDKADRWSLPVY